MFDRILVPLDGTSRAALAIPVASTLAQAYHSQVVLFRVVDTTSKRYDAKKDLERIAGDYASSSVAVTSEVWIGSDIAAQIGWAVSKGLGDLIVMTSRRRGRAGSVADAVVAHSSVPVLVVPAPEPALTTRLPSATAAVA
jgi:nucleotide-binding universal stress UspA family protein